MQSETAGKDRAASSTSMGLTLYPPMLMQAALLVDTSAVGGVEYAALQYLAGQFFIANIALHQGVSLACDIAVGGDKDGRVAHGASQTACHAVIRVVVVRADDSRLGGGIGVVQPCAGQELAEGFHIC